MTIIITKTQMAAFEAQARQNFVKRLAAHFEANYAGQLSHAGGEVPTGSALEQIVLDLFSVAEGFGISTERGMARFVTLGLGYSRAFYQSKRVVTMLEDPAFSAEE